jgi:hypothetical protein
MILSASRRTDIPAFYSEWFMNRLRAGYLLTRNPFNHAQVRRVELSPQMIDCIVFWTKDPAPMMSSLDELDAMGYAYCFQFTLTPYDHTVETGLRPKDEIVQTLRTLGKRLGSGRVMWRYDPIIIGDAWDIPYHMKSFADLCTKIGGYSDSVTISFLDIYPKLKLPHMREATESEAGLIAAGFGEIARLHELDLKACCEKLDLSSYGVRHAGCIEREAVEIASGKPVSALRDKHQRPDCQCLVSVDAGAYNTCSNGCVYCYANHSASSIAANIKRHDPHGEFLLGVNPPTCATI